MKTLFFNTYKIYQRELEQKLKNKNKTLHHDKLVYNKIVTVYLTKIIQQGRFNLPTPSNLLFLLCQLLLLRVRSPPPIRSHKRGFCYLPVHRHPSPNWSRGRYQGAGHTSGERGG